MRIADHPRSRMAGRFFLSCLCAVGARTARSVILERANSYVVNPKVLDATRNGSLLMSTSTNGLSYLIIVCHPDVRYGSLADTARRTWERPLYPRKRTSPSVVDMSAKCQ